MTDSPPKRQSVRSSNNQNMQDISARLESIEATQAALMDQLNAIAKNINGANIKEMQSTIERIKEVVDGDPNKDITGLRKRMRTAEDLSQELVNERNKIRWILTGVALTGITNLGTLITLLAKAFGGSP